MLEGFHDAEQKKSSGGQVCDETISSDDRRASSSSSSSSLPLPAIARLGSAARWLMEQVSNWKRRSQDAGLQSCNV